MTTNLIGREVLGRYRVLSEIGKGAMSLVYLAEQPIGNTTRHVAVKAMKRELSESPVFVERFHREAAVMTELRHPNTIKILDSGTLDDGALVIVMEYINGEPLSDRQARGDMDTAQVDRILLQLCGALDEAHQLGITHRDLKPENILLEKHLHRDDFVKLMDFGIASDIEDAVAVAHSIGGEWMGTPPYMSPEQFTAEVVDRRSDIYSLGIICYELLSGELPLEAESAQGWMTAHSVLAPRPLSELCPTLHPRKVGAVMRALSKSPRDRHPNVLSFLRDFTGYADSRTEMDKLQSGMGAAPTTSLFPALDAAPAPAMASGLAEEGESSFRPGMKLDFELDLPGAVPAAVRPKPPAALDLTPERDPERVAPTPPEPALDAPARDDSSPVPKPVDMTKPGWDHDILDDQPIPEPPRQAPRAAAAAKEVAAANAAAARSTSAPFNVPLPEHWKIYAGLLAAVLAVAGIVWLAKGDDMSMDMARSNYRKGYNAALADLRSRRDDDAWRSSVEGRITQEKVVEGARKQIRASFADGRCGFAQAVYIEVSVRDAQEELKSEFNPTCPAPSF